MLSMLPFNDEDAEAERQYEVEQYALQLLAEQDNCENGIHAKLIIKQSGPHIGEFCELCGAWLRWVPKIITQHDPSFIMPFGQFKGQAIKTIDTEYLQYGANAFSGSMGQRFKLALAQRYKDFGCCLYRAWQPLPKDADGYASLKDTIEAFRTKRHIDAGRVHLYLAHYAKKAPAGSHIIDVNIDRGLIKISSTVPTE